MTTWCRAESPDSAVNRRGSAAIKANGSYLDREERLSRLRYINQQHPVRHSIADILGWEQASVGGMMASDFVDVDVVYSDEPLDLSLDKSKSSRKERDYEREDIKRAKYHRHQDTAASDAGTDEADADASVAWNGAVQPHLQMAANFSTVLQYYLTAARLWQTSEAMRCQESQDGEAPSEPDVPSDPTAAVVAAMAAAAAAAAANAAADPVPQAPVPSKKRKKDDPSPAIAPSTNQHVDPATQNGPTRPRKTRTTFTGKQLFELERIFEQKKYLSSNERQEVARLLNVTGSQIKIWFQNRRTKWKKQDPNTAAELAQLKSASRSQVPTAAAPGASSATPVKSKGADGASNSAEASASEEGHSDDGSSQRSSPAPPV